MSSFFKKTIQISLIIAFLAMGNIVIAQETSTSLSSIYINISPVSPRAGDSVVLTLSSNLLNLNSSKIVWYIDGTPKRDAAGKSITIKAKSDGQKTTIRAVVETSDGIIKEASQEISPAGVDLVVEPMSYTLPFYKGKPYFAPQGTVKVVAIPDIIIDGTRALSKDLNFKWSKGDIVLGSSSGKGNDTLLVYGTIPVRDINISVQISDDSGNILAENSKLLTTDNPEILFYEDNPLYGVLYNEAVVGNYNLGTREELTIVAKPFSFDFSNDVSEESDYTWNINGNSITPAGKANELVLKQTTNVAGTASVSLDLKNVDRIMQYVSDSFNISYGQ